MAGRCVRHRVVPRVSRRPDLHLRTRPHTARRHRQRGNLQQPRRKTETYGLHSRYTRLPAGLARYGENWNGDECTLWAEGEVIQAAAVLALPEKVPLAS
jgi:hypothetical protein